MKKGRMQLDGGVHAGREEEEMGQREGGCGFESEKRKQKRRSAHGKIKSTRL